MGTYCGWTKSISHHLETMVETMVAWYLQKNRILPDLLRCEKDFETSPPASAPDPSPAVALLRAELRHSSGA